MTFDEIKHMKPLEERQRRVMDKIKALPELGGQLFETLVGLKRQEELKMMALQASMGRALWDEYWAVYKDTVEQKANELFTRMETKDAPTIF